LCGYRPKKMIATTATGLLPIRNRLLAAKLTIARESQIIHVAGVHLVGSREPDGGRISRGLPPLKRSIPRSTIFLGCTRPGFHLPIIAFHFYFIFSFPVTDILPKVSPKLEYSDQIFHNPRRRCLPLSLGCGGAALLNGSLPHTVFGTLASDNYYSVRMDWRLCSVFSCQRFCIHFFPGAISISACNNR